MVKQPLRGEGGTLLLASAPSKDSQDFAERKLASDPIQSVQEIAGKLYDMCTTGDYNEVKKILDTQGRQAITKGLFNYNPLHAAASNGHHKIVTLLVEFGADVNCKTVDDGYTPLHLAASAGHVNSVRALLAFDKTDVHVTDAFGRTAMEIAEQNFKTDVAKSLRSNGKAQSDK